MNTILLLVTQLGTNISLYRDSVRVKIKTLFKLGPDFPFSLRNWNARLLWALLPISVMGCSNPYSLTISDIDYMSEQTPGVIQFTDPKLYNREALINERRKEIG